MPPCRQRAEAVPAALGGLVDMQACMPVLMERAGHLAVSGDLDAEQSPHVDVRCDRQQRVIAPMLGRQDRRARWRRRVGQRPDDVDRAHARLGVETDGLDRRRRRVLVGERRGDPEDPRGIGGGRVGAERVREATVRALDLLSGEWLRSVASRRGSCCRCPDAITIDGAGSKSSSAATACSPSQSAHSTKARLTASRPPCRRVRGAQPT